MHRLFVLGLAFATVVARAQHGPSTVSSSTAASTTATLSATLVPSDGCVPLFEYEKKQLTEDTFANLSPDAAESLLDFDSIEVTSTGESNNGNLTFAGSGDCKVYPGDSKWPALSAWALLNDTSDGSLLAPRPAASICYIGSGDYNSSQCDQLTANWTNSYARMIDPIEIFSPVYEGLTCQPPSWYDSGNCTRGGYPLYTMNATTALDVQLAVNFARNTGVRLVVKNTGHDFSGKSAGASSLSIWTHNLKNIAFIPSYNDATTNYSGPAFKAGSGVQAFEIYAAARGQGLVVVGGEGETVGVMGGYVQGGGHSPLSSLYGMGADQVLNYEVITSDGRFVTANAKENADLFWALRGGGGSTFGVVLSTTIKAHPDMVATSTTFTITTDNITYDTFWAGFRAYLNYFPRNADLGTYSYFFILPDDEGGITLLMQPFFAPNKTIEEARAVLEPWITELNDLGIDISPEYKQFDTFWSAWNASFPLEAIQKTHVATASRLWPRANFENQTTLNATFDAIRANVDDGLLIISFNQAPTWANGGYQDTAVNPAWRETVSHMLTSVNWNNNASTAEILDARDRMTNKHMQRWRDLSPGAGCYLAESDRMEPNFQWAMYGSYYPKLLELKKRFDPRDVFWAATAVGSEFYEVESVDGLPNENGKLCRKAEPQLYRAEGPDWLPS